MSEQFRQQPEETPEPQLYVEKETQVEKELSPEVVDKIMEKVQDINEKGKETKKRDI
ncbi:MAG: hypothetical protein HY005_03495 [Candidatus Staskawiczbacteria bacterium]|nr:hypothetical protein [Candidatus Staskawiczbacteria bacterium]